MRKGKWCIGNNYYSYTIFLGGIFGAVGATIGYTIKQDIVYDMSDLSIDEKRAKIQKIIGK